MRRMKEETYHRYVETVDETHPFLVDDYRMEIAKEVKRISAFYKPLIQQEADELIPKIHALLESETAEQPSLESEKKLLE